MCVPGTGNGPTSVQALTHPTAMVLPTWTPSSMIRASPVVSGLSTQWLMETFHKGCCLGRHAVLWSCSQLVLGVLGRSSNLVV